MPRFGTRCADSSRKITRTKCASQTRRPTSPRSRCCCGIGSSTTKRAVMDKATKQVSYQQVTLSQDEGPRPDTTAEGRAGIKPVVEAKTISTGDARQFHD